MVWSAFHNPGDEASAVAHMGAAMLDSLDGNLDVARQQLLAALERQPSDAIREYVQRLLGQRDMGTNASAEADGWAMPHFPLSDYLSGQTRY